MDAIALTLFQAVALHSLFGDPAVQREGVTTSTGNWRPDAPWAPPRFHVDFECRLYLADPRLVLVHPSSWIEAFEWDGDELTGAVYPTLDRPLCSSRAGTPEDQPPASPHPCPPRGPT